MMTFRPPSGDLLYTGAPASIGPASPGDICVVSIDGLDPITTQIGERRDGRRANGALEQTNG